jgi:very-short-patch-repair endonuclease
MGRFVVDFVCREKRLIVEVDGSQHLESPKDRWRDEFLRIRNYRVLRFENNDVLTNPDGVCEAISVALLETPPYLDPLPASGERRKKIR